ncbi:MAG: FAD-binding protein, partial [Terrimesophilobacter sp.]
MNLSELTTLRVGGPARELLSPGGRDDLIRQAIEVWASGEPWLLIGGGSNLLISDDGFDGTVIHVATRGIEHVDSDPAVFRVQAGEPWDSVVAFTVNHGLSGIEALSGIPGSAGASPVQNIGAYGQELSAVLDSIEFLDAQTHEVVRLSASDLELGYRTSTLKRGRHGIVVSLDLRLEPGELS